MPRPHMGMTRKRRFPPRKTQSAFAPRPSFSIFAAYRSNARRADCNDCHRSVGSMRTIQKLNGSARPATNAAGLEPPFQSKMSLNLRRNPIGRRPGKNSSFRPYPSCVCCGPETRRISQSCEAAMTTPAAVETIGALLKKELERAADDYASNPVRYNGPDWWQLSDEEAFVFDINPDRWPVLMTLYHFYQSLVGVTDGFSIEEENHWE